MRLRRAGALVVLGWLALGPQTGMPAEQPAAEASPDSRGWLTYESATNGLSFRYPPSLRVRERDPREFQISPGTNLPEGLYTSPDLVVDLVGDTPVNRGTTVLEFRVSRKITTPKLAAEKMKKAFEWQSQLHEAEIANAPESGRPVCSSLKTMNLDGHEALLGIDCGRAAWHWRLTMLQPRHCEILTGLTGADYT
jgi:hypothetical protein